MHENENTPLENIYLCVEFLKVKDFKFSMYNVMFLKRMKQVRKVYKYFMYLFTISHIQLHLHEKNIERVIHVIS